MIKNITLVAAITSALLLNTMSAMADNDKDKNAKAPDLVTVIKKVQAAGYTNLYKVECEEDKCEVKAHDKDGKKVELKVDPKTYAITKD